MDGKLIDSIIRFPPSVTGDGKSTVGDLIHRENAERLRLGIKRSQGLITYGTDLHNTIAEQGLNIGSVVAIGRSVILKQAINENAVHENACATERLCTSIVQSARRAAELVGLRLAGVDVITRDASLPLDQTGGAIIEVNATPNLYIHYLDGREGSVATSILQAYFDNPTPTAASGSPEYSA
jgi:cyanophycin synthetase